MRVEGLGHLGFRVMFFASDYVGKSIGASDILNMGLLLVEAPSTRPCRLTSRQFFTRWHQAARPYMVKGSTFLAFASI